VSRAAKARLLATECAHLKAASLHLRMSSIRVADLMPRLHGGMAPEDLERFESMASRFARLADLLIQRVSRLVDDLELIPSGSVLDRILRAEKRGWTQQPGALARIRELRNLIAHEYAAEQMAEIYGAVYQLAPVLDDIAAKAIAYADALLMRLSQDEALPPGD
jgi:hypothetical protein